jgi:hypothetical protein
MKIDTTHTEVKEDGHIVHTCQLKVMTGKCKSHCETFLRSKEDDKDVNRDYDDKMTSLCAKYCLRESAGRLGPDLFTCNTTYIIPDWNTPDGKTKEKSPQMSETKCSTFNVTM